MKCPQCQFESPIPGFRFCGQCGSKLAPICAHCGTENPPGFKFCGMCGQLLGSSPAPPVPAAVAVPVPPPAAAAEPPAAARPAAGPVLQSYTPSHLAEQVLGSRIAL